MAALLLSAFPELTPERLRAALVHGASRTVDAEWDPEVGRGVINAAGAHDALERQAI